MEEGLWLILTQIEVEMRKNPVTMKSPAEQVVKDIRRATRKLHSSEEKIRVVLSGLRGEARIAELCRKQGFAQSLHSSWSKELSCCWFRGHEDKIVTKELAADPRQGGRDEPHLVAQLADLVAPLVGTATDLHRHNTRLQLAEEWRT